MTDNRGEGERPQYTLEFFRRRYVRMGPIAAAYLTFEPYITARNFIRALVHPNPRVASPPSKRCHMDGSRGFAIPTEHVLCGLRENFDPRARWRLGQRMPCCGLRKEMTRTMTKRTIWRSALTMEMITGAGTCRRCVARHRNQTRRDGSSTFRPHRRMIARYGRTRGKGDSKGGDVAIIFLLDVISWCS